MPPSLNKDYLFYFTFIGCVGNYCPLKNNPGSAHTKPSGFTVHVYTCDFSAGPCYLHVTFLCIQHFRHHYYVFHGFHHVLKGKDKIVKAMLHEAIFLATCLATMTTEKHCKLQRGVTRSQYFFATCNLQLFLR